ncbi:helix-turn-helix domain-containing protein [Bacillus mesophilum]|uniref:Helix-turn-helix transcriptional regulator n=1 Tax=Bacillus mesophilum TaxID=1071718 RepID=A0A7V7V1X6_9BACI|nr:helix-turn-helix transcriptional regulator [Bacillus mesophilum]KAB2335897.1 helix-turn-helix transcriptional regulator [Bacillus mesophilum]
MSIGTRITKLRKQANLTQQGLADKLGITRAALSHYEKDRRDMDSSLLIKLSDFFEVSTDFLLKGEDFHQQAKKALEDPDTQIAARDGDISDEDAVELLEWLLKREKGRKPGDKQN